MPFNLESLSFLRRIKILFVRGKFMYNYRSLSEASEGYVFSLSVHRGGGRAGYLSYASCGHAGGLSCFLKIIVSFTGVFGRLAESADSEGTHSLCKIKGSTIHFSKIKWNWFELSFSLYKLLSSLILPNVCSFGRGVLAWEETFQDWTTCHRSIIPFSWSVRPS